MKRYVTGLAVLTAGICALVGLFNYRVDPFSLYHFERADTATLSRIDLFQHMRMTKPWHIRQLKPREIVIGTSRTATVDPAHPSWPGEDSYNLAVPGMTLYEMLRFIEHAHANGPLEKLTIGLDFEVFIHEQPAHRDSFEEARLARSPLDLGSPALRWRYVNDAADTLLSLPGLSRSVAALAGTGKAGRRYFKDGTWETTSSIFVGRGGYIYVGKANILDFRDSPTGMDANFQRLAEVLRFIQRQGIEARIFVTPEHVFMLDLWRRIGYGDEWVEFHRRLVELNTLVAVETGRQPVPLIGFNHWLGVVDEPIRKSQESADAYFLDGVHFRKTLGKRIIKGVWTEGDQSGVRLDAGALEQYLLDVDQLRRDFESGNKAKNAKLRRQISPALDPRKSPPA